MAYIICEPCVDTKDTACVDVCPVDCIHPRKDEAAFAEATMLYIHPDECIDCGACVPACPVDAIFALDETPHNGAPTSARIGTISKANWKRNWEAWKSRRRNLGLGWQFQRWGASDVAWV